MKRLIVKDQDILLLSDRAMLWEQEKTLVIADIHLGKAATFRSFGIHVPEGCMQEDLNNLKSVINKYKPKQCIIAGDLIHAPRGLTPQTIQLFAEFLKTVPLEVHLILGNHDLSLKKSLPQDWKVFCHHEKYFKAPFVFKHFPEPDPLGFVWSGHIHPCVTVNYVGKKHKFPCFIIGTDVGILPAFTTLVSGLSIRKKKEEHYYAIVQDEIFEIPGS